MDKHHDQREDLHAAKAFLVTDPETGRILGLTMHDSQIRAPAADKVSLRGGFTTSTTPISVGSPEQFVADLLNRRAKSDAPTQARTLEQRESNQVSSLNEHIRNELLRRYPEKKHHDATLITADQAREQAAAAWREGRADRLPASLRDSKRNVKLTDVQFAQQLREKAREFYRLLDQGLPQSRETALAKTKMEEAILWAEVAVRA